jgi:ferredoxin, 2Fe-2S
MVGQVNQHGHWVTVQPSGARFQVQPGETVFAAAARAGLRWPTICGGNGSCGTCCSQVVDGHSACSDIGQLEAETLSTTLRLPLDGDRRLMCQVRLTGGLTVRKRGVRPAPSPNDS